MDTERVKVLPALNTTDVPFVSVVPLSASVAHVA